jgi:glycerophosphoryl diester phosphodiesterase
MWQHRSAGRPRVFAHRGAMGYAPENTFAAFELALKQGADVIEFDVHLSADQQVVVIHDETLERTTNGHGIVGETTLADLKKLDAGSWRGAEFAGQKIPTLDEVLAWARGRCNLDIEIKADPEPYEGLERIVVDLIHQHTMQDEVLVISFDHRVVQRVKSLAPDLATGILYNCRPVDPLALARMAGADAIMPTCDFCDEETIARAHEAGLSVNSWATSDTSVMAKLIARGVDSICSNHPDRVVGVIRRQEG